MAREWPADAAGRGQMGNVGLNNDQRRDVAESLEATPELLPFLPELLADVWVLGSDPEIVVDLLRPLALPVSAQVVDLGCGKGALAIPIARELGFRIVGVDLFEPFVREARERAARLGVADRCRFEVADLRDVTRRAGGFDVALYAALGLLGELDRCVRELRRIVRPGGYLVIDDGYLADADRLERPGYAHLAPREESRRRLTAHGDELLEEVIVSEDKIKDFNRTTTERIRRRAEPLVRRHPDVADAIQAYVARQEEECRVLESEVVGAVWLLHRAP